VTGHFEFINDAEAGYRVTLVDDAGNVLAVSERYNTTEAAARGIYTIREIAASGLIDDKRESSKTLANSRLRRASRTT
jgi:uncharacterized protein YegP (UPF0339 family)